MKKVLLPLILCLLLVNLINAQHLGNKDALSIRAIFPNYQFQINNELQTDDFTVGAQVAYSRSLGQMLNLSIPFSIAKADYPRDASGTIIDEKLYLGLDALLQFRLSDAAATFNPSLYAGIGMNIESFDAFNANLPLGILFDIKMGEGFYLSPKLEYRLGFSDNRDNFMPGIGVKILVGASAPPPVTDRDGDGVLDTEDLCPDTKGLPEMNGCPDSDGDGVVDGEDACPNQPGYPSLKGCPDSDQDGIIDPEDDCPNEYGPAENRGCPQNDRDQDGVIDSEDLCPDQPGLPAQRGCPDTDGDGIADHLDACPRVAGSAATRGCPDTDGDTVIDAEDDCPNDPGPVSNNGCPGLTDREKNLLKEAAQAIQFETASAILTQNSLPILDQIAAIMQRYRDYSLLISGHTDSIGSAMANQQLSEKRAKACYDYLISRGVDASRVQFKGLGESKPIADNRSREGRELNRRVEFEVKK